MKTIGLIGGMSWESTADYYKIINQVIKKEMGALHSAKCILYSVDFHEIEQCQIKGDWEKSAEILSDIAITLEKAGADFIVICTNTMHKVADTIQKNITIPIIHIADVTADRLIENSIEKVGLLGTIYTMEQDFYKNKIVQKGIEVIIPSQEERLMLNHIIYNELCVGIIKETSKKAVLNMIDKLNQRGAMGVILGCTEIGMLVKQEETQTKIFDTSLIHATKAALLAIS